MSQLFARVFLQILDSSIAEDFTTRHVFEDFLKLADYKTGTIDMTRQALSRRLNIPLELLNEAITKLESPDPASRDSEHEGRRIERLDDHRDWGWVILNHAKYDEIRTKADAGIRLARHRSLSGVDSETMKRAEEIYAAYPRKVGKPDAMRAIVKALSNVEFDKLLAATKNYAEARSGEDEQFTPYPSTWFNQQRYNDDPATWKPTSSKPSKDGSKRQPFVSELRTQLEVKRDLRNKIVDRGTYDPGGNIVKPADRAEFNRLNKEIAELMSKIDSSGSLL